MNDPIIKLEAEKQHQRTIVDAEMVIREFFKELDASPNKPIYPKDMPEKLLRRIHIIVPRLP